MFPERFFQFRPDEVERPYDWLTPRFVEFSQATAGTSAQVIVFEVPVDRFFLLQSAAALAIPGAAQIVTRVNIQVHREFTGVTALAAVLAFHEGVSGVADRTHGLNWQGSIIVPPKFTIQANANFNAGAVANTILCHLVGLLIPLGNIQRGG